MKSLKIETVFNEYNSADELNPEDRKLLNDAIDATKSAYAPYSHYHVGAAVLLENGITVKGSNQENAAYPSGLCAERVALFAAGAHYPDIKIKAIAVTAFAGENKTAQAVSPCGDCRQVMAEYEHRYATNIRLIMPGDNGKILIVQSVKTILPLMFNSDNLSAK